MNTKFAPVAALGALSLAAMAPQASAADNGFYLGAGITSSKFDVGNASDSLDDNSYKLIAGFRPLNWLPSRPTTSIWAAHPIRAHRSTRRR